MNKSFISYFFVVALILSSCSESLNPSTKNDHMYSSGAKGASPEYYYWYKGEKINLTVNREYVNIVIDTALVKKVDVSALCKDFKLVMKSGLNREGLFKAAFNQCPLDMEAYCRTVEELRTDSRIKFVLPYFERNQGLEPIGTSQFFYVQLKEIVPEDKESENIPYLEKMFDSEGIKALEDEMGVRVVSEVPFMPDWYKMSIEGSGFLTSIEAANRLFETGKLEEIDPAFIFCFQPEATNDPLFSQQWGLKNTANPGYDINVEGAWSIVTGTGIKVAIVDNGIDMLHNDIAANLSTMSYDAQSGSCPSVFISGNDHGTHVAGIAGAVGNNNLQIAGVAYGAKMIGVSHSLSIDPDIVNTDISMELASGINWAWINGADVINNSWGDHGGLYYNWLYTTVIESAIENALTNGRNGYGTTVVFASGNFGSSGAVMDYPATSDDRIITVGSIGKTGYRSDFSGYGTSLDVVAPGEGIISLLPSNNTGLRSGTSMAAPHVSGVAALMLAANPYLTRAEVERIIQHTAKKISPGSPYTYTYYPKNYMFDDDTWNQQVGYGLVDATAAVSLAQALTITPNLNGTGMHVEVSYSPTNNDHYYTISGGAFPKMVTVSLLPAQINSSYTYFWRLTTSAYPNWTPTLTFADDYLASIDVPAPSTTSTLYIQCFIYNGSTLVDVPSYALTVNP